MSSKLPNWLIKVLPKETEAHLLTLRDDNFVVISPEKDEKVFTELKTLFEYLRPYDVNFDENVKTKYGPYLSYSYEDGSVAMLMQIDDKRRRASLERAYESFLKIVEMYDNDPDNFVNAWKFIDSHPGFWNLESYQKVGEEWRWNTSGYMSKVSVGVDIELDYSPYVSIDAGGTVRNSSYEKDNYKTHYADWRLEVVESTYEKAVVLLAKHVRLCFDLEGEYVENIDDLFEKPKWVSDIEARISDLE